MMRKQLIHLFRSCLILIFFFIFFGGKKVLALNQIIRPNGDSTPLQWTSTGTSHYTEIDEIVTQPTAGTTTDNVNNGGTAQNVDQYNMETITSVSQATDVIVWVYGLSSKSGSMSVDLYWDGAIQSQGSVDFITSYSWQSVSFTGLTLSQSQLDNLEILITGDAGGRTYTVATLYADVTYTSAGTLTVDIVDSGGVSVANPSVSFSSGEVSFTDQTTTGTFGTSSERIRVSNTTGTATWTLSLAASGGSTDLWNGTTYSYDYNDPTANGGDGTDTDSYGGQLTINPSVATISPQTGCGTTGISLGSSSSYDEEASVESITVATATSSADTGCYWDITGVSNSQIIPPEQPIDNYSIDLVLTITAT